MKLKSVAAALAALGLATSASAVTTADLGSYTLSYDETTSFGWTAYSFTSSGGAVGFSWYFSPSVGVISSGPTETASFDLPSFTITANAGWTLGAPASAFMGNLVFTEVGLLASTSVTGAGNVSLDGGPAVPVTGTLSQTVTFGTSGSGFASGYFAGTKSVSAGSFNSLDFSGGTLTLSATGGNTIGSFASIVAQPQNEFKISFTAMPVPEAETYAMLLAGLGVVALLVRRRRDD